MYDKYTWWEFHGETSDHISDEEHDPDFDNDDSGFAMLQDACGLAGMDIGGDEQTINNNQTPHEPNADALKFYRLLKEYQEPLTVNGETMSKLSYIVQQLHFKVLGKWTENDLLNWKWF